MNDIDQENCQDGKEPFSKTSQFFDKLSCLDENAVKQTLNMLSFASVITVVVSYMINYFYKEQYGSFYGIPSFYFSISFYDLLVQGISIAAVYLLPFLYCCYVQFNKKQDFLDKVVLICLAIVMPALYTITFYEIFTPLIALNTVLKAVLPIIFFLLYLNVFLWFLCKGKSQHKTIQKYFCTTFNKKIVFTCYFCHFLFVILIMIFTFCPSQKVKENYEITQIDGQFYAVIARPGNNIVICPLHADGDNITLDTSKYRVINEYGVEYSYVTFKAPPIIDSGK